MNKLLGFIFGVVAYAVLSNIFVMAGLLAFAVPAGLVAGLIVFLVA